MMRGPPSKIFRSGDDPQTVQVFCRIKPNFGSLPSCVELLDSRTIKFSGTRAGLHRESLHTFSAVYDEHATQENVFEGIGYPLISNLLRGKDGLLLAYGTTGSGKTYTMQGNTKNTGILAFSLDTIFNSIDGRQTKKYVIKPDGLNGYELQSESDAIMDRHRLDYQQRLRHPRSEVPLVSASSRLRSSSIVSLSSKALYCVFVSLVEVYNNYVYDLLQEPSESSGRALITHLLREDVHRKIYVSGCLLVEVKSADDALRILNNGRRRRRVGQTSLNAESSRSHCIFTIRIVRAGYDEKYDEVIQDKNLLVVSQLCLVDLAGSERASRSGTQGSRLREASGINSSLMNLRKCIEVLREIQLTGNAGSAAPRLVVPYRDKRLTHLFKSYFEGDGKVVMMVCINPSVEDYEDLMHVLKFAETSQEVSIYRSLLIPPTPSTPLLTPGSVTRSAKRRITGTTKVLPISLVSDSAKLLAELDKRDSEINHILAKFTTSVVQSVEVFHSPDMTELNFLDDVEPIFSSIEPVGDVISDSSGPETALLQQDSAPEHDQPARSVRQRSQPPSDGGVEQNLCLLRRLLMQRTSLFQQASDILDHEYAAFRQHLLGAFSASEDNHMNTTPTNNVYHVRSLKPKIRCVEADLSKQLATADEERSDCRNQVSQYRTEVGCLRSQLTLIRDVGEEATAGNDSHSPREESGDVVPRKNARRSNSRRLRPSCSHPNLVAVLSRQWESRLAAQCGNVSSRNKCVTTSKTAAPSSTSKAAFNPRHRRSCSISGCLLEHEEHNAVPLGTVMLPSSGAKRRKSVKQIELKDTKNATDYLLHHQEADEYGNLRTSLYKGTIIPTAGGGSAVVFNDVEELLQRSPCASEPK